MKDLVRLLGKVVAVILICAGVFACSEDDVQQEQSQSGLDQESQAIANKYKNIRMLCATWKGSYASTSFQFLSNGDCLGRTYFYLHYLEGKWSFEPSTNLLTTTCSGWTWNINLLTLHEWSGTLTSGETYSYERTGDFMCDTNEELLIGTWVGVKDIDNADELTDISVTFKAGRRYEIVKSGISYSGQYGDLFWADSPNDEDEYVDYLWLELSGDLTGSLQIHYNGYSMNINSDDYYRELSDIFTSQEDGATLRSFVYSDFIDK